MRDWQKKGNAYSTAELDVQPFDARQKRVVLTTAKKKTQFITTLAGNQRYTPSDNIIQTSNRLQSGYCFAVITVPTFNSSAVFLTA